MRGSVAHGLAWESGTKLAIQIVSWGSTIFVARLLTPADYGLFAIVGMFLVFLQLLCDCGIETALVTRTSVSTETARSAFWFSTALSVITGVLLFAAAGPIAAAYEAPALRSVTQICSIALLVSAVRIVPYAIVLRHLDYRFRALAETGGQFVQAVTVVPFALGGFGVWSLVWSYLAGQTFTSIVFLFRWHQFGLPAIRLGEISDLLKLGWIMTLTRFIALTVRQADTAIISTTLGSSAVGLYAIASQFANLPIDKIGTIAGQVAFPAIAQLQNSVVRARGLFLQSHFLLLAIAAPATIGIAVVSADLVECLLSQKWQGMAMPLAILCAVATFKLSALLMNTVLEGFKRVALQLPISIATAIIGIPLAWYCARWGVAGVAAAWAVVAPLIWVGTFRAVSSVLDLRMSTLLRSITPVAAAICCMLLAIWCAVLISPPEFPAWYRLASKILVGAGAYAIALWIFVPRAERDNVIHFLRSARL